MLKKCHFILLAAGITLTSCGQDSHPKITNDLPSNPRASLEQPKEDKKPIEVDIIKLSEAYGNSLMKQVKTLPPDLQYNPDLLIKGLKDAFANKPAPLSPKEYQEMSNAFQQKIIKISIDKKLAETNALFEKNNRDPEIIEIVPQKLQYKILKQGTGETVLPDATPIVKLTAMQPDGTPIPVVKKNNDPVPLKLTQGFPGISLAVPGMKEGEVRLIYIHPEILTAQTKNAFYDPVIFEIEVIKANDFASNTLKATHGNEEDDEDDDGL